jgi:uncharacterized repeat protein (TIGR03843 family)
VSTSRPVGQVGDAHPDDALLEVLAEAELTVVGRILPASNLALLVTVDSPLLGHAIVKPVAGERPLWDFPDGSLAGREEAAYLLSRASGLDLIRPTVVRDVGDLGRASVQAWVGDPEEGLAPVADLVQGHVAPAGHLTSFLGEGERGEPLAVVHEDAPDVRALALLDVVLNQADRKGSHMARDDGGRLWAFDQGLCLHEEPKLRTILWGWAGQSLTADEQTCLEALAGALDEGLDERLAEHLSSRERRALRTRIERLGERGRLPAPSGGWPSIPWPPL